MKRALLVGLFSLLFTASAQAVTVSITSTVQVNNAPAQSILNVQCGTTSGVYTLQKQFYMNAGGIQTFPIGGIIPSAGNWFCVANFINPYGTGPNTTEFALTITVPSFATPSFTVIP